MKMLFNIPGIEITNIDTSFFTNRIMTLRLARLDKIHPVISGNKLFKLHYFLENAVRSGHEKIITFGGAFSNHLVATAYACNMAGLQTVGIVRGERSTIPSHTLLECERYGMELHFISRLDFEQKDQEHFQNKLAALFGRHLVIPEGGYHPDGAKGASLIMEHLQTQQASHICTAIGTATTVAGLLQNRKNNESIIGIPVLKNMTDIEARIAYLNENNSQAEVILWNDYHFGGYAKKNTDLFHFMNELYMQQQLPTDFVYTAKMMYAVTHKIKSGYFAEGSNVVCLHTGGLQGNASLPTGTLLF